MSGPSSSVPQGLQRNFKDLTLDEIIAVRDKLTHDDVVYLDNTYNATVYKCIPAVVSSAKGIFMYGPDGKTYYDYLSCFGAVNQGHCHPKILEAVQKQHSRSTLTSRAFYSDNLGLFCKFMSDYFGYERVLPMNSGTEAAEAAVKLARRWGYDVKGIPKNEGVMIFCEGNFWGRSISAVSSSTDRSSFEGYGPYTPGMEIIPFDDVPALEACLKKHEGKVCAFMVEPIQGEAGVIVPADGYLKKVSELCKAHNTLLLVDEVQTGLGRTGKLLCSEHDGVRPDIVVLGKALSGGVYPVSAVLADSKVMLAITYGSHGSTFGGNPVACMVAIAALGVLRDEKLAENALKMGAIFRQEMTAVCKDLPWVVEVRGRGLMNCVEVDSSKVSAWDICVALAKEGVLCKPTHKSNLRMAPPLCITEEQCKDSIKIVTAVFNNYKQS
eukprot:Lankesteria_metandrocarpae@DN5219_c1_g1_i2.p1